VTKGDKRLRIRIRDLLDTVGLNLDQECDICPEFNISGEAARLRRTGVELDVTLFYSNLWFSWNKPWTWIFPDKDITFEVQVSARQPVEGVRTIRTAGRSQLLKQVPQGVEARVTQRTYGVRMFFHQRGLIGRFCAANFISFLVRSLTFLTIAWSVSEILVDFTPTACRFLGMQEPSWYSFLVSQTNAEYKLKNQ